jgi:hypothetical protein
MQNRKIKDKRMYITFKTDSRILQCKLILMTQLMFNSEFQMLKKNVEINYDVLKARAEWDRVRETHTDHATQYDNRNALKRERSKLTIRLARICICFWHEKTGSVNAYIGTCSGSLARPTNLPARKSFARSKGRNEKGGERKKDKKAFAASSYISSERVIKCRTTKEAAERR